MSHDIRTPINVIMGMTEIADKNADDAERQAECRENIRTASGYLLGLVNDVLDMRQARNHETYSKAYSLRPIWMFGRITSLTGITFSERTSRLPSSIAKTFTTS